MVIPGTTIEVLKLLQQKGLSVQQIANLMGASAASVYRGLNGDTSGEMGLLAVQLYIKLKLADVGENSHQKKLSGNVVVPCRIRVKRSPKKINCYKKSLIRH